jgi:GNAT superfamily N-acetyltransferase
LFLPFFCGFGCAAGGRTTWEAIRMEGAATSDRDALLAFELALDEQVDDEVRHESWGRLFLTPSLPLIWDSSWAGIERVGLSGDEVVAIADEALGGEGFDHRTVCVLDEADGRRLGEEMEAEPARWPGWEVERTRYMLWRGGEVAAPPASSQKPADSAGKCERVGVREVGLAEIADLRGQLIRESMPRGVEELEATVDQLLELERRYGEVAGDRWFVAPAEGEPRAACRLMRAGDIGQVEDVATREDSRERGYAKAIVLAAVAAAQAAGDSPIFLTAEAADWPQLMYGRLGFETVGELTVLRRRP